MAKLIDLSKLMARDETHICPFCDSLIDDSEEAEIFISHGFKMIGHVTCILKSMKDLTSPNREAK